MPIKRCMQSGLKRMFLMNKKKIGSKGKISIFKENIGNKVFNGYLQQNNTKYFS